MKKKCWDLSSKTLYTICYTNKKLSPAFKIYYQYSSKIHHWFTANMSNKDIKYQLWLSLRTFMFLDHLIKRNCFILSFYPHLSVQFCTLRIREAFLQMRQRLRLWRLWTTRGRRCSLLRRSPRWPSTPAPSSPTCSSPWWLQEWTTPLPLRRCRAAQYRRYKATNQWENWTWKMAGNDVFLTITRSSTQET